MRRPFQTVVKNLRKNFLALAINGRRALSRSDICHLTRVQTPKSLSILSRERSMCLAMASRAASAWCARNAPMIS
jgi:hypothetical protein